MKDILCDDCKKVIGLIEEDALVTAGDQFEGIEKYCFVCKKRHISDYFHDSNDLILILRGN